MSDGGSLLDTPFKNDDPMQEVQRSLGRIEGLTEQVLKAFESHREDDQKAFDIINKAFEARDARIAQLNSKIEGLQSEQDRARGAGKVILALLAAAATFVGSAVIAVFSGKVTIKF